MQEFVIVFDIMGKPFRTTVKAVSRFEAQEKLKEKIVSGLNMRKDKPSTQSTRQGEENIDFLKTMFGL
jgi:hypothetical protein